MKIRTILFAFLSFPLLLFSQEAIRPLAAANPAQPQTGPTSVAITGLGPKNKMLIQLSTAPESLYLNLSGTGWGAATVDSGNKLVLVLSNDSSIKLKATSLQSFEPGLSQNTYDHRYYLPTKALEALSRYELRMVRKYSFTTYFDIQVPRENGKRVQKFFSAFFAGLARPAPPATEVVSAKVKSAPTGLKEISLRDIRNYIGDSVQFCSRVFKTRYFEASADKPTVLDVQANFTDPLVNVVILEKDRLNFSSAPEKRYLNKDVCISGLVSLRNNVPYLEVRSSEQVKVKSAVSLAEAELFEGDTISFTGRLFAAAEPQQAGENYTLLNLGAPADAPVTLLLDKASGSLPLDAWLNKAVTVTGKVVRYRNKPQVILRSRQQVVVLPNQEPAPAFVSVQNNAAKQPELQPVQTVAATTEEAPEKPAENAVVANVAQFAGGADSLKAFLARNLVLPKDLPKGGEKQVVVSFWVDAAGNCRDFRVVESAGSAYDKEAKKALQKMPRWKPAFFNGNYFETKVTQTVVFRRE